LNRARRSALRTALRTCGEVLARGSAPEAEQTVRNTCRLLDRAANRGTLHRNAAARRKSRLARRRNALQQKTAG
jgi:small subunit ribosomal protein S20